MLFLRVHWRACELANTRNDSIVNINWSSVMQGKAEDWG